MTQIIYGSELAMQYRLQMQEEIEEIRKNGKRVPCLAVVLAGDNPASVSYIRGKEKACAAIGMDSVLKKLPADVSQQELENVLKKLSDDSAIDGILLQLPLPSGLDENSAINCISPEKDVDGLTPINFGRMFLGEKSFPEGKHAVVVGRSKLVGTPVARLLQNANATVTICHSHTRDLARYTKEADILICAIGKAEMIDSSYIKEGAFVVDVGVNRKEDGHLCGDVKFDEVKDHCTAITPVPKGVGPMTITMLLRNTLIAYKERT